MKTFYVFDKDGTLTESISGNVVPLGKDDQILLPNVFPMLTNILLQGDDFCILSNQGGVSFGHLTEYDAWQIAHWLTQWFPQWKPKVYQSFYHPSGQYKHLFTDTRKPSTSLLKYAITKDKLHSVYYACPIVFVGNAHTDKECAENFAKQEQFPISFVWAHDFFQWPTESMQKNSHGYSWDRGLLEPYLPGGVHFQNPNAPVRHRLQDEGGYLSYEAESSDN